MALPFLNLQPLAPGDDDPNAEIVDGQIVIPNAPFHIDLLYMTRSTLQMQDGSTLTEPGLFCGRSIRSGQFIGFYSGSMITDGDYTALSPEIQQRLGRYAVSMDGEVDITVSPIDPQFPNTDLDFFKHPLALANESSPGQTANAFVESRVIETGDAQYTCVCMFACSHIEKDTEITWVYGTSYERHGYTPGGDCPHRPTRLENPFDALLLSLSHHPGVEMIAYRVPDSSSEGSGSDAEYDPTTQLALATFVFT